MNKKTGRGFMMYICLIAVFIVVALLINGMGTTVNRRIEYSTLLQKITDGEISRVAISSNGTTMVGLYNDSKISLSDFPSKYDFETNIGSEEVFNNDVKAIYAAQKGVSTAALTTSDYGFTVDYRAPITTPWYIELLPTIIMIVLMVALWLFIMRSQGGGNNKVMNFGKSHARMADPKNKVTFADVAGEDEEKEELREIVDFLKNPKMYTDMGARIPKGVLLVGPPGTGKTLLAKAVSGEANVPFFSISGSDFVEMFVGVGASRVRDLFDQAKKAAPSIIFIDEIDAVGRHRGAGMGGGHDEREQTLNQLLVEMDGFSNNEGVIVMAATNRRDILDPALLRPGRFDRQVTVNYPDLDGREAVLKVHSKGKPLNKNVDLRELAKQTPFSTGADLENIMNEAAILSARNRRKTIDTDILREAVERVQMGPEKRSHKVTPEDKRMVALHEGGHAIVGHVLPNCDDVHLVTIVPRGTSGGHTLVLPSKESDFVTKSQLLDRIAMSLGGNAAEKLMLGDISTGAQSDLKYATQLAKAMVTKYGMSESLGHVYLSGDEEVFLGRDFAHSQEYSEEVAAAIDSEVKRIIETCYETAYNTLVSFKDKLTALSELLVERETVSKDEFRCFMDGIPYVAPAKEEIKPEPELKAETGDKPAIPHMPQVGDDDTEAFHEPDEN